MMTAIAFVERCYELDGQQLLIQFQTPVLAPGGEFQCHWTIQWPAGTQAHYACGIDGIQALMLAMRTVHTELLESDAYRSGRLTYLEEADLGLPAPWTFEDGLE